MVKSFDVKKSLSERFEEMSKQVHLNKENEMNNYISQIESLHKYRRRLLEENFKLKGRIRVFVRIRQLNETEKKISSNHKPCIIRNGFGSLVTDSGKRYFFDHIFGPDDTQETVFREVEALVESVLDGFNSSILAYGQTGSGKTYTMEGSKTGDEGVILRSVRKLFEASRDRPHLKFNVSYIEVYQEKLVDLLGESGVVEIHQGVGEDTVVVTGAKIITINSLKEMMECLRFGSERRHSGSSAHNEHSSRSHAVFQIQVESRKNGKIENLGKLNLVDLAGSERLGVTGDNDGPKSVSFKEGKLINQSLTTLGKLVIALLRKDKYIPYRESTLTYLLKDAMGGSAKTLFIIQVTSKECDLTQSMCTLQFAQRASRIELQRADSALRCKRCDFTKNKDKIRNERPSSVSAQRRQSLPGLRVTDDKDVVDDKIKPSSRTKPTMSRFNCDNSPISVSTATTSGESHLSREFSSRIKSNKKYETFSSISRSSSVSRRDISLSPRRITQRRRSFGGEAKRPTSVERRRTGRSSERRQSERLSGHFKIPTTIILDDSTSVTDVSMVPLYSISLCD
eukprot:GHVL01000748.1.p1 GENE.GHVL01000748.1~~GHVL01000748.1.p1  ORF type:complete len:568 (-),score=100.31 GHVL01000748.1:1442-3145(-)